MKALLRGLGVALCFPLIAWGLPPRGDKGQKPVTPAGGFQKPKPGVSAGTPSLSPVARPATRPQPGGTPSGFGGRPGGVGNSIPRPQVSLLPGASNRPSPGGSGGTATPPNPGSNFGGGNRPSFSRPVNNRPDVVTNRPDININRPSVNRPDVNVYRPNFGRPTFNQQNNYQQNNYQQNNSVVVNRPIINNVNNTTVNNVVNQNTTVINKNYGNQNTFNRPYRDGYYRPSRDYYPQLHSHWQPTTWTGYYRPAYYNYSYSSGAMTVSATNFAYANPFYVQPAVQTAVYYDYSRPLPVPAPNYQESNDDLIRSERAISRFDDAREVFRRGEYGRANELIDEAIQLLPGDPNLHEFRSLVLFARNRYPESAAALYSVLAVSPGWDAGTIARLYDDPQTYLTQAAALEEFAKANPQATDARFLLAYHDLVRGDQARCERLLQAVLKAQPDDHVVQNLLAALEQRDAERATER